MSELRREAESHEGQGTLEDLARAAGAELVASSEELVADIWESDTEVDEFLADARRARNRSLAGLPAVEEFMLRSRSQWVAMTATTTATTAEQPE